MTRKIPGKPSTKAASKPLSVLFIGNSQCNACNVPRMVEELAASDKGGRLILAGDAVVGGASLKKHWDAGTGPNSTRGKITGGKWNYVVVQEIFCVDEAEFRRYARKFHKLIRSAGARMVLFCTASIMSAYPEGFERLHRMHMEMGRELNVPVVDSSHAYQKYLGGNPSAERMKGLFHMDLMHPGLWGSYIYACGIYSALTGRCPIGLSIIPAEALKGLQEAAWAQHLETTAELGRQGKRRRP